MPSITQLSNVEFSLITSKRRYNDVSPLSPERITSSLTVPYTSFAALTEADNNDSETSTQFLTLIFITLMRLLNYTLKIHNLCVLGTNQNIIVQKINEVKWYNQLNDTKDFRYVKAV